MTTNRFDRIIPKSWEYPESIVPKLPVLDYEMMDQMLGQQQGQFDLARTISEKNPNVLQTVGDQELYNQYRQMVDTGLNNVSKAYAEQGAAEGSRQYRQYVESMRKAWQPNGVASALQDRYTSYYNAKKAIDDFYKDDVRPVNKTLAYRELQKQLQDPINYNNGTYKQIVTPQTYKDPDLRKAINEMIKQIDDSGDTEFLGDRNKSWWIEKIKTTGRPEDKIALAYQALSEQPEFASQIQRDAQYQSLSIDPQAYQERFNKKLDDRYARNEALINGKNGKTYLEQQGYDVSDLKKAKADFLKDQKDLIDTQKQNFDLNASLMNDVSEDYKNYALGFSSKKIDRDLIFNKALDAQLKNQRAKERNAALFGIRDALTPQPVPTGTITSGIAQQLPELDKHYDNLKKQQAEFKTSIDNILRNPQSTFNGWKMEDVAFAQNLWTNTMEKLPPTASREDRYNVFANALRNSGSYQWKGEQIDKVFNEFSSVNGSSATPAIQSYYDTQQEIDRIDNARTNVGVQFVNTPEGKQSLNLLNPFRKSGETDEQLIQRAYNNPEQFEMKQDSRLYAGHAPEVFGKTNAAKLFAQNVNKGVKENKSKVNYNWGDMATYDVNFNADDKLMGPLVKTMGESIENGSQFRYSSEGSQGLIFRDSDGSKISVAGGDKVNVISGKIATGKNGTPVIQYKAEVKKGDKTVPTTVSVDIVPGSPEEEQVVSGLKNTYVNIYNSGNIKSANAVLDNIYRIQKPGSLSDASTQVQVNNLTKAKSKPLTSVYKRDNSGNLVPGSHYGYNGIDTHNDYTTYDPQTGAPLHYKTYAIIDQTGNKSVANVFVLPDGTEVIKSVHPSMSSVVQERLGEQIRAETPVTRETSKIPTGQIINLTTNEQI